MIFYLTIASAAVTTTTTTTTYTDFDTTKASLTPKMIYANIIKLRIKYEELPKISIDIY